MDSSADVCRANGWKVGDVLEGEEYETVTRIVLTAIGENHILAREIAARRPGQDWAPVDRWEAPWTLECRDWKRVD